MSSAVVNFFVNAAGLLRRCLTSSQCERRGLAYSLGAALMLCTASLVAGCTDAALVRARQQIAAGDFVAAHSYFAEQASKSAELSSHQRRLVMDGLCLTEYKIGEPTYLLNHQLRTCATAAEQPGSESGPIFADVARRQRQALSGTITAALAQRDIATADDAILRYRATPGSDPQLANEWTRQLWTVVNREATPNRVGLRPTISLLSHEFRHQQNMNTRQFRHWIEQNMTVDGDLMVSYVQVGEHSVALWLGDDQLPEAALNLDRFARINDGLVARCRCNGLTRVALKESGLPAYLVRLDPTSHRSEVLILDQQ